jgi:hypothetical protein
MERFIRYCPEQVIKSRFLPVGVTGFDNGTSILWKLSVWTDTQVKPDVAVVTGHTKEHFDGTIYP